MSIFSKNLNYHWKYNEQKKFLDSFRHNILELYYVLTQIQLTTSNTERDI